MDFFCLQLCWVKYNKFIVKIIKSEMDLKLPGGVLHKSYSDKSHKTYKKRLCQIIFINKVTSCRLANLLKRNSRTGVFL